MLERKWITVNSPARRQRPSIIYSPARNIAWAYIFVIGCSTSEIVGKRIGSALQREEAPKAVMDAVLPKITEAGFFSPYRAASISTAPSAQAAPAWSAMDFRRPGCAPGCTRAARLQPRHMNRIPDCVMVEDVGAKGALGMEWRHAYRHAPAPCRGARTHATTQDWRSDADSCQDAPEIRRQAARAI